MQFKKLLTLVLAAFPLFAEAKTLEDLLVEKGVITKSEASSTGQMRASSGGRVYYNEGTRIEFPDSGFAMKINTLIQTRYAFHDNSETRVGINESSFDVQNARLFITGAALHNEFRYGLEADFTGNSNRHYRGRYFDDASDGTNSPRLNDAYITWSPCEGYDTTLGQYRTFISRQYNVSHPGNWQFADESIASDHFNLGRQAGLTQTAALADNLTVGAGVWNGLSNGEGVNRSGNDTDHSVGGFLRYNPTGNYNLNNEGDVDNTEDLATTIGVAYIYEEGHAFGRDGIRGLGFTGATVLDPGGQDDYEAQNINVDLGLKVAGFSLQGEYFYRQAELQRETGSDFTNNGGYVQAGYFIEPGTLEIAGRYSIIDCDNGQGWGLCQGNDKVNEAAGTINYYWWKHQMKAQLGYYLVNEDTVSPINGENDFNSNRWVFQFSGFF